MMHGIQCPGDKTIVITIMKGELPKNKPAIHLADGDTSEDYGRYQEVRVLEGEVRIIQKRGRVWVEVTDALDIEMTP